MRAPPSCRAAPTGSPAAILRLPFLYGPATPSRVRAITIGSCSSTGRFTFRPRIPMPEPLFGGCGPRVLPPARTPGYGGSRVQCRRSRVHAGWLPVLHGPADRENSGQDPGIGRRHRRGRRRRGRPSVFLRIEPRPGHEPHRQGSGIPSRRLPPSGARKDALLPSRGVPTSGSLGLQRERNVRPAAKEEPR